MTTERRTESSCSALEMWRSHGGSRKRSRDSGRRANHGRCSRCRGILASTRATDPRDGPASCRNREASRDDGDRNSNGDRCKLAAAAEEESMSLSPVEVDTTASPTRRRRRKKRRRRRQAGVGRAYRGQGI